jgi:hypothetical protein
MIIQHRPTYMAIVDWRIKMLAHWWVEDNHPAGAG